LFFKGSSVIWQSEPEDGGQEPPGHGSNLASFWDRQREWKSDSTEPPQRENYPVPFLPPMNDDSSGKSR
jgi:hypothetical protein